MQAAMASTASKMHMELTKAPTSHVTHHAAAGNGPHMATETGKRHNVEQWGAALIGASCVAVMG